MAIRACKMIDCHTISDNLATQIGVTHIAGDNLEIGIVHAFEPAPVVKGIILAQCPYFIACGEKSLHEMRPYEAVGPGHKHFIFHHINMLL